MSFTITPILELRDPAGKRLGYYTREELVSMCENVSADLRSSADEIENLIYDIGCHYGVTVAQMRSECRRAHIVWPRHVAMVLIEERGHTHSIAAAALRRKCHSSVFDAKEAVASRISIDLKARASLESLRSKLLTTRSDV